MKKISTLLLTLGMVVPVFGTSNGSPELTAVNAGTSGQVYVSNGSLNSEGDVNGHFVNASQFVGPQGPQGAQGIQGVKGDTGSQGAAGLNGTNGLNGKDGATGPQGATGAQGVQGVAGAAGAKGATGAQGIQGATGTTGPQGPQGIKGNTGATGVVGVIQSNGGTTGAVSNADTLNVSGNGVTTAQVGTAASVDLNNLVTNQSAATASTVEGLSGRAQDAENRIDRIEQTKYIIEPVVRLYDSKRWQLQAFDSYDMRHGMNFAVGARLMYKLGRSYEEKRIDSMNRDTAKLLGENVADQVGERKAMVAQLALDKQLLQDQAAALKQAQESIAAQNERLAVLEGQAKSDVEIDLDGVGKP